MESKFFESGNYIYECKTSPSKMGEYFSTSYLRSSINKLKERWKNGRQPSGYRYVFPVNYIDDNGKAAIKELQALYPSVDIRYYECDQVQKLILNLEKVNNLPDLVDYIKQIRR